jgi:hypothetical protein
VFRRVFAMNECSGEDSNIGGALDESVAELNDLVERFLLGWIDPKTGEHRYFKFGSREERAARYAIAYLLGNPKPLKFQILNHLARLFDPSSVYSLDIQFRFRREGNRGKRLTHRRIALAMLRMVRAGNTVGEAVATTVDRHGLEERQVRDIWARYGKPLLQ